MQSCLSKGSWNGERHCGGKREGGEPGWTWVASGIGGALFPHQTGFQFSREQTITTGEGMEVQQGTKRGKMGKDRLYHGRREEDEWVSRIGIRDGRKETKKKGIYVCREKGRRKGKARDVG